MVELIPEWPDVVSFFQLLNSQLAVALRRLDILQGRQISNSCACVRNI